MSEFTDHLIREGSTEGQVKEGQLGTPFTDPGCGSEGGREGGGSEEGVRKGVGEMEGKERGEGEGGEGKGGRRRGGRERRERGKGGERGMRDVKREKERV